MFVRLSLAIVLGSAVTFALLLVMQLMVTGDHRGPSLGKRHEIVDFVRVERPEVVVKTEAKPERPPEPEAQPARPVPDFDGPVDQGLAIAVTAPQIGTELSISSTGLSVSDGEYLPIVTVAPSYPQRALVGRLEGWVLVEFVVTPSGAVRDVVVLESTAAIFEKAAVEAALKFKFRPRVIDGEPVEVRGVKNRIVFELAA